MMVSLTHPEVDAAWNETTPPPRVWTSGPWMIELRGDELAAITYDSNRIARAIRAVARDRDWNTVPVSVTSVASTSTELAIKLEMVGFGAHLVGTLTARATADTLQVGLRVTSSADFWSNRLGLVLLHPADHAGTPLAVIHPDGTRSETEFPVTISPHQPALSIAGLSFQRDGLALDIVFESEVFEMEDQRNWTDASFKTYSTPLDRPFPVLRAAGDHVAQSITITAAPRPHGSPRSGGDQASGWRPAPSEATTVPEVVVNYTGGALTEVDGLSAPQTLLVELRASSPWRELLATIDSAYALDLRLIGTHDDITAMVEAVGDRRIVRAGAFSPTSHIPEPELWVALTAAIDRHQPAAVALSGTTAHFTELNRTSLRQPDAATAMTFSLTPTMHSLDREQLIESIRMQREVVIDAVRIADGRPLHIGPISLRARFNAVATSGLATAPEADPRQASRALGAWLVASAAALAVPGVASVCWFDWWGAHGVINPDLGPIPAARAWQWIRDLAGSPVIRADEVADRVWVLAVQADRGISMLIANLTESDVTVTWGPGGTQSAVACALGAVRMDGLIELGDITAWITKGAS